MDVRGNIHLLGEPAELSKLEERVGKVVAIPPDELQRLRNLTMPLRRHWYMERAGAAPESAQEQRRQNNAAKRERRARRGK